MPLPPIIKIILAGEAGVGKSSLVRRIVKGEFKARYVRTVDVHVYTFTYEFKGRKINIGLRDPLGHRPLLPYLRPYMQGAHVILLVYDIHRPHTLHELGYRISSYLAIAGKKPMILVGNKKDLRDELDYYVTYEEGKKFAEELSQIVGYEVPYVETSAKTGEHVMDVIKLALTLLVKRVSPHQRAGSVFPLRA